ncbi:F-box/LRR-repeat protein 14 [Lutzomyia longipalpis]|uniref:F-box/LRR-repeat protein 14 n=1 Tax=Lutzomyia longipalpis TaxID=7200 RepID=UPI0024840745|nr:F-box/LRR-repeat protein 14 [Lutzomyia longipalpis]
MDDSHLMLTEIPGGLISHQPHHLPRYAPYHLHQPHLQPAPAPQLYLHPPPRIVQRPKTPIPSPPPEGTHIGHLYPELLTMIFAKLSVRDRGRVAQVCTAWRDAAYSKSVWKGVEASLHIRRPPASLFNSLVRRGIRKIQVLSLRRTLKEVITGVPNLESLNLSGCYNITDNNLYQSFCMDMQHLKVLDLSLCKQITDTSLGRIGSQMKNLEVLELGGCSNITNTGLMLIAWSLKKLKRLNLRSCWHISDQGIGHLAGVGPETEHTLPLEYLGLQDCQRLSDEALKYIAQGLPFLRSINLSFCVSVTDSGLKYLAKMPKLEELNLRACDNISDIGMAYLTEGGSSIFSLDVSFCDKIGDQALIHISQGLFHLRSLSLNASCITDDGLDRIAKSLHDLETLNIGQCNRISDKGLKALADNLQNLKAIDLYGCTRLSAQGLELIMKLPKLETLNLGLWHVR